MRIRSELIMSLVLCASVALTVGCGKKAADPAPVADAPQRHEHKAPHGGTPVVLGDESYHLELVLDATRGKLQAYVLDGEMENFVRLSVSSVEINALVEGISQTLVLQPVANPATGETVGDTALFEAQADWLKTVKKFDAALNKITIRGTTFTDVKFNFPKGNDKD
jgi:hypothetical protein